MAASNWDNEECSNERIEEERIGEDEHRYRLIFKDVLLR